MHHKALRYLASIGAGRDHQGATLKQFQVAYALELVKDNPAITEYLENGYDIANCARVNFTNPISWVDILICLESSQKSASLKYVVTYEADTMRLIALSKVEKEFQCLDDHTARLPFALEAASHNVDVVTADEQTQALNSRRELFTKAIMAALVPFLGSVSPAMARETSWDTRINKRTAYPSLPDNRTDYSDDPTTSRDYSWDN